MKPSAFRRLLAARWARLTPFSRRIRHALPPHFAAVRSAQGDLERAMHGIEVRFLKVGESLEVTSRLGRDLVEHCEALIALALGQGGGEIMIDAAAQHIWQAIEFVERSDQKKESLVRQLTLSNEQIRQTLGTEQVLERTIAPLTYVQTLFRVESAGLPPHVQEMFHALVREIDRIRLRVEGGFREKFLLIREIQTILDRAIAHLIDQQDRARQTVADLRQHMTTTLAAMKGSYEKNRDRDTRLSGVSHAVDTATGKVVMALQFQDILNQKLEHARSILAEMEASFAHLPSDPAAACRSLRFIEHSARIVVAQLGAMKEELTKAGSAVGGELEAIISLMATLDIDCLALRDLDSVTTGVDGAVQILLDSVADVRRLVTVAGTQATEAHKTIEPIGGMTTNFTSFMRELSLEIQLIGLNAEVQAAHVGAGTGLEVLSAQTSAISRDTSKLSGELALQLDTLTAGLGRVVMAFREIRDENSQFSATLSLEVDGDESALHDYRDSALKVLMHISEQLPELQAQTKNAGEQADFSSITSLEIVNLQSAASALADAAQRLADDSGIAVPTDGLTDHFIGDYTMRSEVNIHREATGKGPARATAGDDAAGAVELFGDEATAPPAAAGSADQTNVDLWDDSPPPPAARPGSAPPGQKRAA